MAKKMYTRKELMSRLQISIRELHLSSMTDADKKRLFYVEQGMVALDEEQAIVKNGIDELLKKYKEEVNKPSPGGLTTVLQRRVAIVGAAENLIKGLQKLVSGEHERVNYPERQMLETPSAEYRAIVLKEPKTPAVRSLTRSKS